MVVAEDVGAEHGDKRNRYAGAEPDCRTDEERSPVHLFVGLRGERGQNRTERGEDN